MVYNVAQVLYFISVSNVHALKSKLITLPRSFVSKMYKCLDSFKFIKVVLAFWPILLVLLFIQIQLHGCKFYLYKSLIFWQNVDTLLILWIQ